MKYPELLQEHSVNNKEFLDCKVKKSLVWIVVGTLEAAITIVLNFRSETRI
jgi:hypothetical protein